MRSSFLVQCLSILLIGASLPAGAPTRASPIPPPVALSSGFIGNAITETAVDWNGNGLFDAVNLTVPVTLNTTAQWRVSGYLAGNGTSIYNASEFYRGPGTVSVTLSFAGWIWRLSRWNGSFSGPLYLLDLNNSESFTLNYTTAAYTWTRMELRAELAGGYSATPIDANADGLYDYLEVTGRLHAGVPGSYLVFVYLYNASGTTLITLGYNRTAYAAGYADYHMWLDGNAIRQADINGSYRADVWFCLFQDCLIPAQNDTFYTSAYSAAAFAHHPVALAGNVTDAGIDTDGNAKFDYLRVTIPVNVSIAGVYNVSSNLYGPYGFGENGWSSTYLPVGNQAISVDFPGWTFRTNLVGGPFTLQLWVRENISTYQIAASETTAAYIWNEFDSPYGLLGPMTVLPLDTDGNGLYNVIYVNSTIEAKIATTFQVQFGFQSVCCGGPFPDKFVTVSASPGIVPISFAIPGWAVAAFGINGTYDFYLTLRIAEPPAFDDNSGRFANFTWDQFDPAITMRGPVSFHPRDTDGNGRWNYVQVDIPLQILVGGGYYFAFQAFNSSCPTCYLTVNRALELAPGPFDLNLSLSGLDLRSFPGDASVSLVWTSYSLGVSSSLWRGKYAIPDPTVFESLPTQQVTFHLQAPQPLLCCGSLLLVNYTNAYVHRVTALGFNYSTVVALLPVQDYTVFGEAFDSSANLYENLTSLVTPLPADATVRLASVGPLAQSDLVRFADWSSASVVRTRTPEENPGFRMSADLLDQPDGIVTDAEIFNAFAVGWATPPTPGFSLDRDALSLNPAASDSVTGAGPVVGGPDLGYVEAWNANAPPSSALVHVVGISEVLPYAGVNTSAEVQLPGGWTVSAVTAPPGSSITGIGTADVVVGVPASFAGTAFINVTATWSSASYLPAVVSGTVIGAANAAVPSATVTLWQGATQVNTTTTDSQGRFVFGSVRAGTYALRVQASGYRPYLRNVTTTGDSTLDIGSLSLTLLPTTGGLTGRVVDANGNGIGGATLRLAAGAQTIATTRSDSGGSFGFSNILAGSYKLFVNATGFLDTNVSVTITVAQLANAGSIVLQALPTPPADLSWVPWASAAAVVVVVSALVLWTFLRRRRRPPTPDDAVQSPVSDERTLK